MNHSLPAIEAEASALLGQLPDSLVSAAAQCRLDGLWQTLEGVATWREALLLGKMPLDKQPWPSGAIGKAIQESFPRALLRFTQGNKDIVDAVVLQLLQVADGVRSDWENRAAAELSEWLRAEEQRRAKEAEKAKTGKVRELAYGARAMKANEIRASLEGSVPGWAKARMDATWAEQVEGWTRVSEVFDQLQGEASLGWNMARGILRHVGWARVEEMHRLLKSLPQVADVARALGRAKAGKMEAGEDERVMARVSRVREELAWVDAPDARTRTDGIHKSDDIPRMLPMEVSLYRHAVFRRLWKAKFIERSLACYQIKGLERRRMLVEEQVEGERVVRGGTERGPIMVCLDTSGSMQGVPETVAKAITLEAMRLAHAERRKCLLYAFSGPGDVLEHDLDLGPDGIQGLISILCMSFHGGTDVAGPLCKAIQRLEDATWKRADVILVSDGEFVVPEKAKMALETGRKALGLRVHGLLISSDAQDAARRSSMGSICEPLHVFRDWAEIRNL